MAQIRHGMQLRPRGDRQVNLRPPEPEPPNLLNQIRQGVPLRPSPQRNPNVIPENLQRRDLQLNAEEERVYESLSAQDLRERCRQYGATREQLEEGDRRNRVGQKPYFFALYRRHNPQLMHIPNPNFMANYPPGEEESDDDEGEGDWSP